jgi:hypothetical protein
MRMRYWTTPLATALLMWAVSAWGSTMYPRIKADFQHSVVINSETFPPGHYVFQQIRGPGDRPVFRVIDPQGKNLTLTSVAIKVRAPQSASDYSPPAAQDTEVILQKIGGNYYLHRIWIQGRTRGWEFEIPDSVKSQVAQMNEESVPGTYDETPDVAQTRRGETTMQTNAANAASENSNQMSSLTGCLERQSSSNSFYIKSSAGKQTTVKPAGDLITEMANQANHTVRLVGHWSESKAKQNTGHTNSFVGGSDTHSSDSTNVFRADRIDVISTSCQK